MTMARRRGRSARRNRKGQPRKAAPPGHGRPHAEDTPSEAEGRRPPQPRLWNKLLLTAAILLQAAWMVFLFVVALLD